jgi:hypothetical protein
MPMKKIWQAAAAGGALLWILLAMWIHFSDRFSGMLWTLLYMYILVPSFILLLAALGGVVVYQFVPRARYRSVPAGVAALPLAVLCCSLVWLPSLSAWKEQTTKLKCGMLREEDLGKVYRLRQDYPSGTPGGLRSLLRLPEVSPQYIKDFGWIPFLRRHYPAAVSTNGIVFIETGSDRDWSVGVCLRPQTADWPQGVSARPVEGDWFSYVYPIW